MIDKARDKERYGYYCQLLMISEHTGRRVDAPEHLHPRMANASIDRFTPDTLMAPAVVCDFAARNRQPGELISRELMKKCE